MKKIQFAGIVLVFFALYDTFVNKNYLNSGVLFTLGVALYLYEKDIPENQSGKNRRLKKIISVTAVIVAFVLFVLKVYFEAKMD